MNSLKSLLDLLETAKTRKYTLEEELEATDQAIEQLKQQAHEGALWEVHDGNRIVQVLSWTAFWVWLKRSKLEATVTSFGRIRIYDLHNGPEYSWGSAWIQKEQ